MGADASTGALLQQTCCTLVATLDADASAISWLLGDLILDVAQHTRTGERLALGYGFLVSDYPVTREVVESAAPRTVSLLDPEPDPGEARILRDMGYVSLLMLPLVARGRCRALIEVYAGGSRRFTAADADAGMLVAAAAGSRIGQLERAAAVAP